MDLECNIFEDPVEAVQLVKGNYRHKKMIHVVAGHSGMVGSVSLKRPVDFRNRDMTL